MALFSDFLPKLLDDALGATKLKIRGELRFRGRLAIASKFLFHTSQEELELVLNSACQSGCLVLSFQPG